jgi:hypothetical protein
MNQVHLADEALMAYADGELDDSVVAAVEEAMRSDAGVPPRITAFIRSRQLARRVLAEPGSAADAEAVSRVTAMILERSGPAGPLPIGERWRRSVRTLRHLPLAACLVLGAGVAGYLSRGLLEPSAGGAETLVAALEGDDVGRALGTTPSGKEAMTPAGRVRLVSSYRDAAGGLCREFRLERSRESVAAVACRAGADWEVAFAAVTPSGGGAYAPAGGDEVTDLYLQKSRLGTPLSAADEAAALVR